MLIVTLNVPTTPEAGRRIANEMQARTGLETIVLDSCSGVTVVDTDDASVSVVPLDGG